MPDSPDLVEARRLHERGVAQNLAGHPAKAATALRRALRIIDTAVDPSAEAQVLAARIWISLATSESELAGLSRGLATIEQAEQIAAELGDAALEVVVHNQMGYMKVRGGEVAAGLTHLDRAVALIEAAEPDTAFAILINRGTTHLYQGELDRARVDLTQAEVVAAGSAMLVEALMTRHNLGYLEFLAGNLALALRTMNEVLDVDAEFSRAVVLLDRARVLFEAGLHREADESLQEAGELFRADRLYKDVAEVELARAECALIDGEISAARRLAGSARTRFRRRANDRWRREAELVLLQADVAAGRPGRVLGAAALRLAEEFRADGMTTRARTAQLVAAEAFLQAGEVDRAHGVAGLAGPIRPDDPTSARLHTRLVRTRLATAAEHLAAARREARTGLAELARHQAQFGSLDLQTAGAVHGRALAEFDLALALRANNQAGLFSAIERGRAISSRLPAVTAVSDPAVADRLAELRRLSEELRLMQTQGPAAGAGHRRRIVEVQRQLRSQSWQAEGSGKTAEAARLPLLEARTDRDSLVFISMFFSGEQLHGQLVGAGRTRSSALPGSVGRLAELGLRIRADLDGLAKGHLPVRLAEAIRASLRRSLEEVDDLVIRPLRLGDQPVVLAPPAVLSMLPWNMVPSLRGRSVVVSPSATAWLAAADPRPDRGPVTVASLAGPDLLRSADEAQQIAAIWGERSAPAQVKGRSAELVTALASDTIVHVAAHGRHQPENPMFSSIRLTDGSVFAYELDQKPTAAEHVVLSACELGQATIRPGDEALGLTSVLLHLGSRSVISGVARVHDDVAAEVMPRYHRALAAGQDSARALAEACATAIELPAPFVCFGASWTA